MSSLIGMCRQFKGGGGGGGGGGVVLYSLIGMCRQFKGSDIDFAHCGLE